MVEAQLTDKLIHEGAELVKRLDEIGMSPDAAFWFFFPDLGAWKLVLAEIKVGSEGPREVYKTIQSALSKIAPKPEALSLEDVAVAKPEAPIVAALRIAIGTDRGISGIRSTYKVVNAVLIEE